jgi:hypothetical protein
MCARRFARQQSHLWNGGLTHFAHIYCFATTNKERWSLLTKHFKKKIINKTQPNQALKLTGKARVRLTAQYGKV